MTPAHSSASSSSRRRSVTGRPSTVLGLPQPVADGVAVDGQPRGRAVHARPRGRRGRSRAVARPHRRRPPGRPARVVRTPASRPGRGTAARRPRRRRTRPAVRAGPRPGRGAATASRCESRNPLTPGAVTPTATRTPGATSAARTCSASGGRSVASQAHTSAGPDGTTSGPWRPEPRREPDRLRLEPGDRVAVGLGLGLPQHQRGLLPAQRVTESAPGVVDVDPVAGEDRRHELGTPGQGAAQPALPLLAVGPDQLLDRVGEPLDRVSPHRDQRAATPARGCRSASPATAVT